MMTEIVDQFKDVLKLRTSIRQATIDNKHDEYLMNSAGSTGPALTAGAVHLDCQGLYSWDWSGWLCLQFRALVV
jgi:hypothetical protein